MRNVTVIILTADRTRKASATFSRSHRALDIVKTSTTRWKMPAHVDYQVANITRGIQLSPHDRLTEQFVQDGDVLMLQAFPTHGGASRNDQCA